MIEAWGRGFEKIKEACGLYDGPLPEYEINESGIMVLCKACDMYLDLLSRKEKVDSLISDERIMSEKMNELKKEPIVKIVNYLKDNEEITTAKGVEITGKSVAQVRRYLKTLCEILEDDTVVKLVWNNAKRYSFNAVNWSYSKGDTYNAVCIILTDKVADIQNDDFDVHSLTQITKNKLYVAITRTKGDLYFVKKDVFDKVKEQYLQ